MTSKYTEADRSNAIELYLSGLSTRAVEAKSGIGVDFVRKVVGEAGVTRDLSSARRQFFERGGVAPTYRSDITPETVLEEHEAGIGTKEIAAKLGVSDKLIELRLRKAGARRRTPAEARALIDREKSHAKAAESRTRKVGWGEDMLAKWLADRGESPDLQRPEGARNVDIAIGSVAVEIWLSSSSPLTDPYCRKRIEHLRDRGLTVCYVLVSRRKRVLLPTVADQIVVIAKATRENPASPREHWVIRGCGEVAARFGDDLDNVTLVPPSKSCPHHRVYPSASNASRTD